MWSCWYSTGWLLGFGLELKGSSETSRRAAPGRLLGACGAAAGSVGLENWSETVAKEENCVSKDS